MTNYNSPAPSYNSEVYLECPPTPRGRKPTVSFDGKNIVVPIFFPTEGATCRSILGTNDTNLIQTNLDSPVQFKRRPVSDFTLKNRQMDVDEVPTKHIALEDFPTLPFSFPPRQAVSTISSSPRAIPARSSSDPSKLQNFDHRRGASHIQGRRNSRNARCA